MLCQRSYSKEVAVASGIGHGAPCSRRGGLMARSLCDLGLMSLVCDDLASLILDGRSALEQLLLSLDLRCARLPKACRRSIILTCNCVSESLGEFLEMPRECFDEALSCMGGERSDLLWWLRAMDEGHGDGVPSMLGQKYDGWDRDACRRMAASLQGSFDALALGRGQFRESTKLSMALCAGEVMRRQGPEGEGAADTALLHDIARAATGWMSVERLRRRLKLPAIALPLYAAPLMLVSSWYQRQGLGQELILFVQKRQMHRFDAKTTACSKDKAEESEDAAPQEI